MFVKLLATTLVSLLLSSKIFALDLEGYQSKVPKMNLDYWKDRSIIYRNNCYNYATNRAEGTFAQPGEASGVYYKELSCEDVYPAAKSDLGLEPTEFFEQEDSPTDTLIALVVAPKSDFHWYRRDANGMWSHKPGSTEATNEDNSGRLISNPETASRGIYEKFCGYFKVKSYIFEDHEQNAGYVRIGKMLSLPNYSTPPTYVGTSKLTLQLFSGRRNPEFSLATLQEHDATKSALNTLAQLVERSLYSPMSLSNSQEFEPVKLGERMILVEDKEGLIFPAGSRVSIAKGRISLSLEDGYQIHLNNVETTELLQSFDSLD